MPQYRMTMVVGLAAVLATMTLAGCSKKEEAADAAAAAAQHSPTDTGHVESASADFQADTAGADSTSAPGDPAMSAGITDLKKGTGAAIQRGQVAIVHYTGWLYSPDADENKGKKFDSSHDRNEPYAFPLGGGTVIQGWDEGVVGMQVGGQRRLVIPPEKGYGASGAGGVIPPNATLIFDVELLGIQ